MKRRHNQAPRQNQHSPAKPPPATNPETPAAHLDRGNALYALQQYQAAVESYDHAIRLNPALAEAFNNRGSALHVLQQSQAAVASFDEAIRLKPAYPEAQNNRGIALQSLQQYQAAAESFASAIRLKPDYVEAHHNLGIALYAMQQYPAAFASFENALLLKSDHADAHLHKANALYCLQQYQAAVESYDKALQLKPHSAEAWNNRGGALHALQQYQAALESFDQALRLNPDYADAQRNRRNALHMFTQQQAALNPIAKTHAGGRDLVFYCGPTDEIWNPHTVQAKGIGGSEEAVIWLSRLLQQRGWNVSVYCNCGPEEKCYDGVAWKPYWMWNHRDKQDVTIIWRHARLTNYEINSDKVIVDLHDTILSTEFTPEILQKIHTIFVKSAFHRSLYPHIPDEKFVIVPNGIDATLFEGDATRDPLLILNTSSADRSLEAFLDCFGEIKKQVPGAKAQWAYGWGVWDSFYASNPQRLRWKAGLQQRMRELGVQERGRLSHDEIASLYHQANIFAYPSEFAEIDCISLSKAMAAGAIPITTDFAAMGEKSGHGGIFLPSNKTRDTWLQPGQFHFEITDPEQKAQFVREAVKLLLNPPTEQQRQPMREWARLTFDWTRIADAWHEVLAAPLSP